MCEIKQEITKNELFTSISAALKEAALVCFELLHITPHWHLAFAEGGGLWLRWLDWDVQSQGNSGWIESLYAECEESWLVLSCAGEDYIPFVISEQRFLKALAEPTLAYSECPDVAFLILESFC